MDTKEQWIRRADYAQHADFRLCGGLAPLTSAVKGSTVYGSIHCFTRNFLAQFVRITKIKGQLQLKTGNPKKS